MSASRHPNARAGLKRLVAATWHDPRPRAMLVGLLLGTLAWAISRFGDERAIAQGTAGVAAAVMVVCGGIAFVLYTLHSETERRRLSPARREARSRTWMLLLGLSCLAAVELLSLVA